MKGNNTMTTTTLDPIAIIAATLQNGGYTSPSVVGRYVVATPDAERILPVASFTYAAMSDYIREHGESIGTWFHEGYVYLDKVTAYDDATEALAVAHANGQLAIYDATLGEDFMV